MAEKVAIDDAMTAGDLHDRLAVLGADLMARALAALPRGGLAAAPQSEDGVTYARKIEKGETRIDWTRPAREVHNHIRGLSPFPGAWCEMPLGSSPERVKVLRSVIASQDGAGDAVPGSVVCADSAEGVVIACGSGTVRLVQVQRAGRKPMNVAEFLRGAQLPAATRLA